MTIVWNELVNLSGNIGPLKKAYSIFPPLNVTRDFDILIKKEVRGVAGLEYQLREINLDNKTSLIDLWFTYPRSEAFSPSANLESLYKARLNQMLEPRIFGTKWGYLKQRHSEVDQPMYALLLAMINSPAHQLYNKVHSIRVIPRKLEYDAKNEPQLEKISKSNMVILNRYHDIIVPMPASNVKYEYQLKTEETLFESADSRDGVKTVRLLKKPYSDLSFQNCYQLCFRIDLTMDVSLRNLKILSFTENKVTCIRDILLPGMEGIEGNLDDKFLIRCGDHEIIDERDLHAIGITSNDPLVVWTELSLGLLRHIVLCTDLGLVPFHAKGLLTFADRYFNLESEHLLPTVNVTGYVKMGDIINILTLFSKEANNASTSRELLKESVNLLQKVYGSSYEVALPAPIISGANYNRMLEDLCYGVARLPSRERFVQGLQIQTYMPCLLESKLVDPLVLYFLNLEIDRVIWTDEPRSIRLAGSSDPGMVTGGNKSK